MNKQSVNILFAILYVACFVGAVWLVDHWKWSLATISSAPIILSAETIVFCMVYATIFFDGHEDHPSHSHG